MPNLSHERFYGSRRVKLISNFMMNGVHHTRVQVAGESSERVVLTTDLTEEPVAEFTQSVNMVLSNKEEKQEVVQDTVENKTEEVEQPKEQLEELVEEALEEPTEEVEQSVVEESTEETVLNVVAIAKTNGKEHILGSQDQLETNEQVKKLKLDPEAIERVFNGDQKSHKGFTFELREV